MFEYCGLWIWRKECWNRDCDSLLSVCCRVALIDIDVLALLVVCQWRAWLWLKFKIFGLFYGLGVCGFFVDCVGRFGVRIYFGMTMAMCRKQIVLSGVESKEERLVEAWYWVFEGQYCCETMWYGVIWWRTCFGDGRKGRGHCDLGVWIW